MKLIRFFFCPLALIYKLIVQFRNILFNINILKQTSFDIPIISVGNLVVGGSGKTPQIEYLFQLLKNKYKIAIISRGYKRKTKGFLIANKEHTYLDIGDEPCQYKQKFGDDVIVAVGERRRDAIEKLLKLFPDLDVILLDDAYQHRYVKAGLNILLTDIYHPFYKDHILPVGGLREPRKNYKRADIIVVTKTYKVFSALQYKNILTQIRPKAHQKVFFSSIKHNEPIKAFDTSYNYNDANICFLFAGIANVYPLQEYLNYKFSEVITIKFPDHHIYTLSDIKLLKDKFEKHYSKKKIFITTEKDLMRLRNKEITKEIINLPLFYIPIRNIIHQGENFNKRILNYVEANKRNNKIY